MNREQHEIELASAAPGMVVRWRHNNVVWVLSDLDGQWYSAGVDVPHPAKHVASKNYDVLTPITNRMPTGPTIIWEQHNHFSGMAVTENDVQADALMTILGAHPLVRRLDAYCYDPSAMNFAGERIVHKNYLALRAERGGV